MPAVLILVALPWMGSCDSPTEAVANPTPPDEVPAHTHDASAVVSGWFDDARFSPTIRIIDRDTVRFAGVVGWGGGPMLESSDLGGLMEDFVATRSRLDSLVAAFDGHRHDASDIDSGTLPDTRLSANVALLSAPVLQFEGALAWGGGPVVPSSTGLRSTSTTTRGFTETANVFTQPQTFLHRTMVGKFTGDPTEGSGTVGLRFERSRDTELSPLGVTWTLSGGERWALGLDEGAESHPDFVLLYNTGVGDIFRVADGAHFQMGAGVGPSPTEHLLFLNDRPGSGNQNVLNMQGGGDATRYIRALDPSTGVVPFAVGIDGSVGVGTDHPTEEGLMLDVAGDARARSWETLSDARLKEDVRPVGSVLERLARLQAVQFRWKESGQEDLGVLAQEVEAVFPELVTERDGVKSVDYSGLTAVLLAAVTELAGVCGEHGTHHTH
ncbi:MAG: tail fiber domain-containing protein [Longimicrobiales bacterium]